MSDKLKIFLMRFIGIGLVLFFAVTYAPAQAAGSHNLESIAAALAAEQPADSHQLTNIDIFNAREAFYQCAYWDAENELIYGKGRLILIPKMQRLEYDSHSYETKYLDETEAGRRLQEDGYVQDSFLRGMESYKSDRRKKLRLDPRYDKVLSQWLADGERNHYNSDWLESDYCYGYGKRPLTQDIRTNICGKNVIITSAITSYCEIRRK